MQHGTTTKICDTEFGDFRNEGTDFDKLQSLDLENSW